MELVPNFSRLALSSLEGYWKRVLIMGITLISDNVICIAIMKSTILCLSEISETMVEWKHHQRFIGSSLLNCMTVLWMLHKRVVYDFISGVLIFLSILDTEMTQYMEIVLQGREKPN